MTLVVEMVFNINNSLQVTGDIPINSPLLLTTEGFASEHCNIDVHNVTCAIKLCDQYPLCLDIDSRIIIMRLIPSKLITRNTVMLKVCYYNYRAGDCMATAYLLSSLCRRPCP